MGRIALSAQMMAMTKEHAQMETQLNENQDVLESKWRKQMESQKERFEEKEAVILGLKETIAGLEGEIEALKGSLQKEKSVAVAEAAEDMSKLGAEINILKERIKVEELKAQQNGMASEKMVAELENQ